MYFAIFRRADHSVWMIHDFPAQRIKTTNIFTSRAIADHFLVAISANPEWEVGELPDNRVVEWARQSQKLGVSHLVIDCNPSDRAHKTKTVVDFLAQLADSRDGSCQLCGKTCRAIGQQLAPGDVPVFDRETFNGTAVWCSRCRRVFCGACLGATAGVGGIGKCPTCHEQTSYATSDHWHHN